MGGQERGTVAYKNGGIRDHSVQKRWIRLEAPGKIESHRVLAGIGRNTL